MNPVIEGYALCHCADGHHADAQRGEWHTTAERAESGVHYMPAADAVGVHLVRRVATVVQARMSDAIRDYVGSITQAASSSQAGLGTLVGAR
jgi:hypothetical protein